QRVLLSISFPRLCQASGIAQQFEQRGIVECDDALVPHDSRVCMPVRSSKCDQFHLQVPSQRLLTLQRLEERLKVSFAKAARALAFNHLKKTVGRLTMGLEKI